MVRWLVRYLNGVGIVERLNGGWFGRMFEWWVGW